MNIEPVDLIKEIERRYPDQFLVCLQALQIQILSAQLENQQNDSEE